jgi:hypothetical protein
VNEHLQDSGRAELRLARRALVALSLLAVPTAAVAWAVEGVAGALGAVAGVGLVAVLFAGGGLVQSVAVRRGGDALGGVVLAGLGARLFTYVIALIALGQVAALHRPSLAAATAVAVVCATYYEMRLISRTPELFWVQAGPRRGSAPHGAAGR